MIELMKIYTFKAPRLKRIFWLILGVLFVFSSLSGQGLAQQISNCDKAHIYKDTVWYDPCNDTSSSCECTSLVGSDREEQTWNFFKANGLSDEQVAGVMGNILQESHFDPEIMQIGGDSKDPYDAGSLGWGIVQWSGNAGPRSTGDKVTAIYRQTGVTGPVYELCTQLDMVWAEMNGVSPTGVKNMVQGLKQISDPAEAARYFNTNFEGGTDPGGIREQNAINILKQYQGKGSSGGISQCKVPESGDCNVTKPVYEGQYSQEQLAAIFGDPGTAESHPDLNLVSATFQGRTSEVSPLVKPCLEAVSKEIDSMNIKYSVRLFGCYRYDSDNGSSNIGLRSYHTYGAACDINWDTNPFIDNTTCDYVARHDMPQEYVTAFYNHGFTWGGNWCSVKDYMHFEWHGVIP